MSTKERYGTLVWEALLWVTRPHMFDVNIWATVGEVSERAKVSKPTAKKYLDELVKMGHATEMKFGNRTGYRSSGWRESQNVE